jgi:predicted nucleic acid-binding protein
MDKILIDTDVILDFFFDREPFSPDATKILSHCELKKITGFVTPVIISNTYYLLKRTARHEKVIEKLSQLMKILDVLQMDKNTIIEALNSNFKDFEDALQNSAAVKSGFINAIITSNVKDFAKSDVAVFTPENYLKSILAN